MSSFARRVLLVLLAGAVALFVVALASGGLSRALMAARILDELRRPGENSWLRRATPAPSESTITLAIAGRSYATDLYRPGGSTGFPLLLVPGAIDLGKDDPRVAPFARLLARAGFTVLVPELPSMRTLRVHPDNVRELADAVMAAASDPALAPEGAVGIFGISYAGGVGLLVALEPVSADRVRFVATVGSHADLDSVLRFHTTQRLVHRGRDLGVTPDPYGQLVFLKTYEEFLTEPADRERLAAMVARRTVDLDAALEDLAAGLTPEARLIYDLFEHATLDEVPALLAQMHEGMRERMAGLSPARRDFTTLRARLYLAHDRNDTTIPFVESLHIADLAHGRVRTRLVVLEILHHVDPKPWRTQPWEFLTRDVPEAMRLGGWWCALLEERGR